MIIQLAMVVGLFVRAWRDYAKAPRLPPSRGDRATSAEQPSFAVFVPARNEAANIGACLDDLCRSKGVDIDIVVIDDSSTDATAMIVRKIAERDPRITLIAAPPRPAGWCGKSWALSRGVAAVGASVDRLCFVDADVRLAPDTLARAVAYAQNQDKALVSLLPSLTTKTFWESVVQPVMGMMMFVFQPLAEVNDPASALAVANGQFLLVDRARYESAGGHAAVREEIVEDVALARAFKRAGDPVALVIAPEAMQTRMYDGLGSLWEGWGKTIHPYLQRDVGRIWLGVVVFVALLLLPFATLVPLMTTQPAQALVNAITIAAILVNVSIFRAKMGQPLLHGLLWPLGGCVLVALFIWRTIGAMAGWPVQWKQRSYS